MRAHTAARALGSAIRHPDFHGVRVVLDLRPCGGGPEGQPHPAFIVDDDPGWGTTWVCSRDAQLAQR